MRASFKFAASFNIQQLLLLLRPARLAHLPPLRLRRAHRQSRADRTIAIMALTETPASVANNPPLLLSPSTCAQSPDENLPRPSPPIPFRAWLPPPQPLSAATTATAAITASDGSSSLPFTSSAADESKPNSPISQELSGRPRPALEDLRLRQRQPRLRQGLSRVGGRAAGAHPVDGLGIGAAGGQVGGEGGEDKRKFLPSSTIARPKRLLAPREHY